MHNAAEILDKIDPLSSESLISPKTVNNASLQNYCKKKQSSVSPTCFVAKTKWLINLSSRILREAEASSLKNGLNFGVTPANVPAIEIITTYESAFGALATERADTVREAVKAILEQAQPPTPNITKEQ